MLSLIVLTRFSLCNRLWVVTTLKLYTNHLIRYKLTSITYIKWTIYNKFWRIWIVDASCIFIMWTWLCRGVAWGILEQPVASGSVLERPALSRTIRYPALPYVPWDSPQRSVQLMVRVWDDLLETAARADLTCRDPQGDEPAVVRDGTDQPVWHLYVCIRASYYTNGHLRN